MAYFQGLFEKNCLTSSPPSELAYFTSGVSIVLLVTNIPGNLLVILAVVLDPYKNLRTPFNYLMANLAIADLIVGTITDPLSARNHYQEAAREHLPIKVIQTLQMSYFISCTASVLSVGTLAVERYLAVWKPYVYRTKFTTKRVFVTIGCIWFTSLTLPFVFFEVGFITYAFIFANTAIILVVALTIFFFVLMLRTFKLRLRKDGSTNQNAGNKHTLTSIQIQRLKFSAKWEEKITKMFMVVIIAMFCCYGPSVVFIYTMSFCRSCSCNTLHWCRDLQFLFVIANSSVNFFCYALRSPPFRKAFALILRLRRRGRRVGDVRPRVVASPQEARKRPVGAATTY